MSRGSSFLSFIFACVGMGASWQHDASDRTDFARLESFLGTYLWRAYREDEPPIRLTYLVAAADLNDDDADELLVYLNSDGFCGSGGCTLLILTPRGNSYRVITRATIVRLPVRALDTRSNGWRNLAVRVQGGGILEGYEAELRYDGASYPSNPSMPPARRLQGIASGEILFDEDRYGTHNREVLIGKPVVFARLDRFLDAYYWRAYYEGQPPIRLVYLAAATDLNGDDVDELLVYVGRKDLFEANCCNLLILTAQADSFRVVTETSMVRVPIRVLDTRTHGWRNLTVRVQASGLDEGLEAELTYDGESYPTNLSMPPAPGLDGVAGGETLIDRERQYAPDGEFLIGEYRRPRP